MPFQLVAQLPNGEQKSIFNRDEDDVLTVVAEFLRDQTITTRWGNKNQTRQALELRVYETKERYEPPRGCWRPDRLRGLGDGQEQEVSSRGA